MKNNINETVIPSTNVLQILTIQVLTSHESKVELLLKVKSTEPSSILLGTLVANALNHNQN